MTITLRIILILCSLIAFFLCVTRIKQAKLKVSNAVMWMIGCFILILMSIFLSVVEWISNKMGFIAPVNFVFFVMIGFLLIQAFVDNIRISQLNEKIKDLNHYIALKENEERNKKDE